MGSFSVFSSFPFTIALLTGIVAVGTAAGQAQDTDGVLNVATLNITPDERFVSDCSTTAGLATLTCPDGNFTVGDNSRIATVFAGPAGVLGLRYVSGGTITGGKNGWCYATVVDGGGTGAVGYFRTISNGIASGAVYVPLRLGSGYTSAPTAVSLGNSYTDSNGVPYPASPYGVSCGGSATVNAASYFYAPITTTMIYVNSTTVTLGANAVNTLSGNAAASFGTDWTRATQSAINSLAGQGGGTLYFPPTKDYGRYLILSGLEMPAATTTTTTGGIQAPIRITGGGGHWDATFDNSYTPLSIPAARTLTCGPLQGWVR